ncbi:MAG: SIMPL domain-containing protein [Patescibacteria group bacterium]
MEQENSINQCQWKTPKNILIFSSVILLSAIIIVSILRERIVQDSNDITTITGRGKVSYQPDIAVITLGVQIDKSPTAGEALNQLNNSMLKIIDSAKALGISEEDIQTQSYSLYPHYDYQIQSGGNAVPSGYDANQQVSIKVKEVNKNPNSVGNVIENASSAGANQVVGVAFDISNLEEMKQKARIEAITDARQKSGALAKAAGIRKLGKVVSWYENIIKSPDIQNSNYGLGVGGAEKSSASTAAQINSGTEEIIIEVGLNYRIR